MDRWEINTSAHLGLHSLIIIACVGTDTDEESHNRAGCSGLRRRDRIGSTRFSIFPRLR